MGDATFELYKDAAYGNFFAKFLKSQRGNFIFLDIGANQGLYTILASKNWACQQAIAFEPVPATADVLERNIKLNKSANVSIVRKGISDVSGKLDIYFNPAHSGGASVRSEIVSGGEAIQIDMIDATELNHLLAGTTNPIVVKVDVEGYEMTVLEELSKTEFFQRIQSIFYECDESWVDPVDIRTFLTKYAFTSFERIGGGRHYDVLATRE